MYRQAIHPDYLVDRRPSGLVERNDEVLVLVHVVDVLDGAEIDGQAAKLRLRLRRLVAKASRKCVGGGVFSLALLAYSQFYRVIRPPIRRLGFLGVSA